MITQDLEALKGKKVKVQNVEHLVLGSYVTEAAGLVLVTTSLSSANVPVLSTVRVVGQNLEIIN